MTKHRALRNKYQKKEVSRAGAKGGGGAGGAGPPNRHAWAPNQQAYSFENSGFCA